MLVRRAIEPGYGLWVFPGGYVDRGEEVTAAARREAREEAGLDVRLDGLVNIYSYPERPLIIIVYSATWIGGELCTDEESLEARLFPPRRFPGPSWHSAAPTMRCTITSKGGFTSSVNCRFRRLEPKLRSAVCELGRKCRRNRTVASGIILAPLRSVPG